MANEITLLGHAVQRDITTITAQDLEGCEVIGDHAFDHCTSLTSITIPDTVITIGADAFRSCSQLTDIVIGSSVITIGHNVFLGCSALTSITLPSSVTSIGGAVFWSCTSLTSITLLSVVPPSILSSTFNEQTSSTFYVPAESVDAYKTAQYWSSLSSQIQAI